jgi:hypothetical protein
MTKWKRCPVRDIMLVKNVSHPISVVPSETGYGNIASLTGRHIRRDVASSTNIKSLTGFNRPVAINITKEVSIKISL